MVPTRRVDVFREEESVDVGIAIAVEPIRERLAAIAYPEKNVESEIDGDVTEGGDPRSGKQVGSGDGVDSDLSLLDDLFADMNLLP